MEKNLNKFIALMCLSLTFVFPVAFAHDPVEKDIYTLTKYTNKTNPLLKVAKQKTTVGVIPYYISNKKVYVFLGRELKESHKEDAGTYSDFGGNVKLDNSTILDNAIRELREETMGQLYLNEHDLIKNGYLLYKNNENKREIFYIFYKLSEKQYLKTLKFNAMRERLKASSVPNSYLEKDHFTWFNLEDLLQQSAAVTGQEEYVAVQTITGEEVKIRIRGYFLRDCLQNPELPLLLQRL